MKANLKNLLKFLICLCMCILAGVFFAACSAIQSDYKYKGGSSSNSGSSSGGSGGSSGGGSSSGQSGAGDVTPDVPTGDEITIRYDYGADYSLFGEFNELTLYETIKKDVGIVKLPTIKLEHSEGFLGWFDVSTGEKVKIGDKPQTDIDVYAKFDINKVTFAGLFENGKYVKTWAKIKQDYSDAFFGTTIMTNSGFSYFTNLKGDLVIGSDITEIQPYAFDECEFLTGVVIPGSVTTIQEESFGYCPNLESLKICEGTTSIEIDAFYGCTNLKNVSLPNSIMKIGEDAFSFYSNDRGNLQYNTYDNGYYLGNETNPYLVLMFGTNQYITSCQIHPDTKIIYSNSFNDYNGLESIIIPDSVVYIGSYSFYSCSQMSSLTIGKNVKKLGESVFSGLVKLTYLNYKATDLSFNGEKSPFIDAGMNSSGVDVVFADGIQKIPDYLFAGYVLNGGQSSPNIDVTCDIKSCAIPNSVTSIGDSAFYMCKGLTNITIPEGVTSIGTYAFYLCTGLTSVSIPNSLMHLGNYSFGGCPSLQTSSFNNTYYIGNSTNPYLVLISSVKKHAEWCEINSSTKFIHSYAFQYAEYDSISIPDSVIGIGAWAFAYCYDLHNVSLSNNLTYIGVEAFGHCTSLASICIPNSLTTISGAVFYGCESLTSVTIPNSVTKIEGYAFFTCTNLTSITIPSSVTYIGAYAFNACSLLTTVILGNVNGWKANALSISASDLSNSSTAATYLSDTYASRVWSRE